MVGKPENEFSAATCDRLNFLARHSGATSHRNLRQGYSFSDRSFYHVLLSETLPSEQARTPGPSGGAHACCCGMNPSGIIFEGGQEAR